jgi:NAD(P)-dependent dehydrogenase (short-subunit alcohol dehydrogenase family)
VNEQMNLSCDFEGRVAVITGGGSGIGRATARLFAERGAAVAVLDIDSDAASKVAQSITDEGKRALGIHVDVADEESVRKAVSQVESELGRIDVLFNNAGIIRRASVVDTTVAEWDRAVAVNLRGVFLMSHFAIPVMLKSEGGAIVNTGSGWGLVGGGNAASYCATKAAVVNLSRAMAIDHAPEIRVNCVCPGDVNTGMLENERSQLGESEEAFMADAASRPLGRVGDPSEIAEAVVYLSSKRSSYVTGSYLVVDGGGLAG